MIRALINKFAVKSYKKELQEFIQNLATLQEDQRAQFLVTSVWTRAGLQLEGHFRLPDGQTIVAPFLCAYPIMRRVFEDAVSVLRDKGLTAEAAGLQIWTHSLKCLINYPRMNAEMDDLWSLLMPTKASWGKFLDALYDEDMARLKDPIVDEVMTLSKQILSYLPPNRSDRHYE